MEMACAVGLIAMIALPALKYLGIELQGIFSSIDAGFDSVVSDTTTKAEWHPKYIDYDDKTGGLYIYNDSGVAIYMILSSEPEISVIDDFKPEDHEMSTMPQNYAEEVESFLRSYSGSIGLDANGSWNDIIEWIRQQERANPT